MSEASCCLTAEHASVLESPVQELLFDTQVVLEVDLLTN